MGQHRVPGCMGKLSLKCNMKVYTVLQSHAIRHGYRRIINKNESCVSTDLKEINI